MPAAQRGIPRPRKTEADAELREALLKTLSILQGDRTLSALADDLGVSVKTLSRYRSRNGGKTPTLGGDLFFRICQLCDDHDISITCRGRILRLTERRFRSLVAVPKQIRFTFEGSLQVDVPSRKGVMRVDRFLEDENASGM
jgi:hypothetical protein